MNVAAKLEELRGALPGCTLVAYADLSSDLTLCVSARVKPPQEQLDALCMTAAAFLNGLGTVASGEQKAILRDQAVVLTAMDVQIFLRSPKDASDALCCICSGGIDFNIVAQQARATLLQIAAQQ